MPSEDYRHDKTWHSVDPARELADFGIERAGEVIPPLPQRGEAGQRESGRRNRRGGWTARARRVPALPRWIASPLTKRGYTPAMNRTTWLGDMTRMLLQ